MSNTPLGLVVALAAAIVYSVAVTLQAHQAQQVPERHSLQIALLRRLAHKPLWIAGAATGVVGWAMQAAALILAPLTLVEPALAASLIFIVIIGARRLHQPIAASELAAVVAVTAGVAGVGLTGPTHHAVHAGGESAVIPIAALCAAAAAPYTLRRLRPSAGVVAASAGTAYAVVALSTKFVADDVSTHAWPDLALYLVVLTAMGVTGLISEMSALQGHPAHRIAPIVFGLNVLIPIVLAPALAHETWSAHITVRLTLLVSLAAVITGATALARSPRVGALLSASS